MLTHAPRPPVAISRLLLAVVACTSIASADDDLVRLPFPLETVAIEQGLPLLAPVRGSLQPLRELRDVLFEAVPVAPDLRLDLALQRLSVVMTGGAMHVDGRAIVERPDAAISLWSGEAVGFPDSYVYLALSNVGCRGFVRVQGRVIDLVAFAGEKGWGDSRSAFIESDPNLPVDPRRTFCLTSDLANRSSTSRANPSPSIAPPPSIAAASVFLPIYQCRLALETDYQFYQVFNNLAAAQAYAMTLFGAVSDRYRDQVGVILTLSYLGLYTQNNDPWTKQDQTGTNCNDVLIEFQSKWKNGQAPVVADLYHLLSGGLITCGLAFTDTLCNQTIGFSVSGEINGANPFPVTPGPNTWDFMMMAHEIGHNFGALHTHEYCPPIDQCAVQSVFGPCQTSQVCINNGTIMSYCSLCPGGLTNNTLQFHPQIANVIRAAVTQSCLQAFAGLTSVTDLGHSLVGSNGAPGLQVTFQAAGQVLGVDIHSAPMSQAGFLFLSVNQVNLPFLSGTFVPSPDVQVPLFTSTTGMVALAASLQGVVSLPMGQVFSAQVWFNDPAGPSLYAATQGVAFELLLP